MAIGQQESGRTMVELGVEPVVKREMTGFAGRRELCGNVVGIGGFLKIRQVARHACGRKPQEIAGGGVLMALIAFHDCMRAEQRKSIEVLLNRLSGHLPAENCMALSAVASELTTVHVRVAIRAVLAHIGEDRLDVALRAGDFLVQPAERIARGVVIEFGNRPDRAPTRVGVAILTRNGQRTVRTPSALPLCSSRRSEHGSQNGRQNQIPGHEHFQFTAPRLLGLARPGRRVSQDNDSS